MVTFCKNISPELLKRYPELVSDHMCVLGKSNITLDKINPKNFTRALEELEILMVNPWNTDRYRSMVKLTALTSGGTEYILQWDLNKEVKFDCVFS